MSPQEFPAAHTLDEDDIGRKPAIRLAIVGLGLVGRRHADAIGQIDGVELCAVADPGDQAKADSDKMGVAWFPDLDSMITAAQPDGIILSTPTNLHAAQALQSVEAGIPILIEKPISDSFADAEAVVRKSEQDSVPVMVGHHRRFNAIIQNAKTALMAHHIGDIRAVHVTCWFYKPDFYFESAPWRKLKGAGPIAVNLVHDIDTLRYLCGEITHVQAQISPSARGYEIEDVAAAIFRFENGAIGTVTVSDSIVAPWSWECTSQEYPIYPYTAQSTYQIGGSHGSLSIPDLALWTHDQERDWWSPISATKLTSEYSDPLINQIVHFAAVIKGEASPLVSGREGLRTLAVIDAIQSAAKTGHIVQLADNLGTAKIADLKIRSEPKFQTKPNMANSAS